MRQGLNPLYLKNRAMLLFEGISIIDQKQWTSTMSPQYSERERELNKPQLFLRVKKVCKSTNTSSTKKNSTKYSTPIDLLKGMTKKGKNMVLCNKPTRIKCKVELGRVPLENKFRHYLRSKLSLMNEQIHVSFTSFASDGEIDYNQLL